MNIGQLEDEKLAFENLGYSLRFIPVSINEYFIQAKANNINSEFSIQRTSDIEEVRELAINLAITQLAYSGADKNMKEFIANHFNTEELYQIRNGLETIGAGGMWNDFDSGMKGSLIEYIQRNFHNLDSQSVISQNIARNLIDSAKDFYSEAINSLNKNKRYSTELKEELTAMYKVFSNQIDSVLQNKSDWKDLPIPVIEYKFRGCAMVYRKEKLENKIESENKRPKLTVIKG